MDLDVQRVHSDKENAIQKRENVHNRPNLQAVTF